VGTWRCWATRQVRSAMISYKDSGGPYDPCTTQSAPHPTSYEAIDWRITLIADPAKTTHLATKPHNREKTPTHDHPSQHLEPLQFLHFPLELRACLSAMSHWFGLVSLAENKTSPRCRTIRTASLTSSRSSVGVGVGAVGAAPTFEAPAPTDFWDFATGRERMSLMTTGDLWSCNVRGSNEHESERERETRRDEEIAISCCGGGGERRNETNHDDVIPAETASYLL
jgi:hypothetical protein